MQPEAMRVHATATVRPDFAQILARVRSLRPQIASRALAAEKAKRVPAETMDALRDTAVFRLMQPARFGGYEYGPAELAEVGFELGRACGSTGWCGTLAVCFGWMTSFFPLQAQQEVWDDPDNLLAVSYTPSPKVEVVEGGIKIAGQLALGERRRQCRLAHPFGFDSRKGRAADARLVSRSCRAT